jgi:riboflavin synthase
MFTGIIQKTARVEEALKSESALRLRIASPFSDISIGESIAVNGVCLTVTEFSNSSQLFFYVSSETLDRSSLGQLGVGSVVNLERALLASDRLSGHVVQGHVDGKARFAAHRVIGDSHEVSFAISSELSRYCVEKGSIALDGVSLTLNEVKDREIRVMLIPHTWANTGFSSLKLGDEVNVEVDVLAKYMARYAERYMEKLCPPCNTP